MTQAQALARYLRQQKPDWPAWDALECARGWIQCDPDAWAVACALTGASNG